MLIIAHRGNIAGAEPSLENTVEHVDAALAAGFEAEVDVWSVGGVYMLGHDAPSVIVSAGWLRRPRMWCHAKNIEALVRMLKCGIHCFWHEEDRCTLTSRGLIWCYPGVWVADGITVAKGTPADEGWGGAAGVCTDHPL